MTEKRANGRNPMHGKLQYGNLQLANSARTVYQASIPGGVSEADMLEPAFWAHHIKVLRPMDIIEAFCEDGSWEGSYRVMFVGAAEIRIARRWHIRHDADEAPDITGDMYEIKWMGPAIQFAVRRIDTGDIVKDHLYPKDTALKYLREHMQRMT